jgi:hypothetical protein
VRCNDNLPSLLNASHDGASLDDWKLFHGTLDPEIAAGDHDRIAFVDDILKDTDGVLIFNFRNDTRLAAMLCKDALESLDVRSLAAKAQCDVVDSDGGSDFDIGQVLLSERRQIDFDAR